MSARDNPPPKYAHSIAHGSTQSAARIAFAAAAASSGRFSNTAHTEPMPSHDRDETGMRDLLAKYREDLVGLLRLAARPGQVCDPRRTPAHQLHLVQAVGRKRQQQRFRLGGVPLPQQCSGQEVGGLEGPGLVERRAREPFPQRDIRQTDRILRRVHQQIGFDRPIAVESQLFQANPIRRSDHGPAAQSLHELSSEPPACSAPHASSNHFTEQWMRVADVEAVSVFDDSDEAASLGLLHCVVTRELTEDVQIERLAESKELQRLQHVVGNLIDPVLQQGGEFGGDGGTAPQLPDPTGTAQRPRFESALHQMPDEQRVPARRLPDHVRAQPLEGAVQHGLDQLDALFSAERRQFEPQEVTVLPQRRDRVGHGLAVANGGDDVHRPVEGKLMKEGRRELIEEVRVVDTDHHVATVAVVEERLPRRRQRRPDPGRWTPRPDERTHPTGCFAPTRCPPPISRHAATTRWRTLRGWSCRRRDRP